MNEDKFTETNQHAQIHEPSLPNELNQSLLTEEQLNSLLQIQLVDVSGAVHSEAADSADESLRQRTVEHGVKGFIKKIWYGNIARDYIRQRDINRNSVAIIENQNIYTHSGGSIEDHRAAMAAVIERVTSDYGLLHEGEKNQAAAEYIGGVQLEERLKLAVGLFARGEMDYDDLETERLRLNSMFGRLQKGEDRNKGLLYADNVIEVARNARAAFEHGIGLDAIDQALKTKIAEVELGVRTPKSGELADRIIDRLYKSPIGSLVSETTLATAVAVGIGVSKFSAKKIVTALGATIAIGVGASGIAAVRESYRLKQEKRLHDRQMAEGGELNIDNSKRRQSIEETRYRTANASDLIGRLTEAIELNEPNSTDAIRATMDAIAEAQTRIELSDKLKIDLIRFDSKLTVEQQRRDLDIALAGARVKLRKEIEANVDNFATAGLDSSWADTYLNSQIEGMVNLIEADFKQKNIAFKSLRRKRMLGAAAIGFVVGSIVGGLSEELKSVVDDSLKGVFAPSNNKQTSTTELANLLHRGDKVSSANHRFNNFEHSSYKFGKNALDLPAGYHVVALNNGTSRELLGPNGKVVLSHVQLNEHGTLSSDNIKELQAKGFKLEVSHQEYQTTTSTSRTINTSTAEYIASHQSEFTTVHRNIWYDNNLPYPNRNELATWWGGQNGTGINAQGNFVLNVSHMTPGGSYEGSQAVNYQTLLQNHQLGLAISIDQSHQNQVVLLHFNNDGNVIIPAGDPVLGSVFQNQDGHAAFLGAYAEVVQIGPSNAQGTAINMLGTLVGSNQVNSIPETIQSVIHESAQHIITHIEAPQTTTLPVQVTPVIPVLPRKGLEDLASSNEYNGGYYRGYAYVQPTESYVLGSQLISSQDLKAPSIQFPLAPELQDNPDVELDASVIAKRYLRAMPTDTKKKVVKLTKQLSMEPNASHPRAVVVIPVAAHQEGKNIYQTLLQYSRQQNIDFEDLEIITYANYPEGTKPDQTIREIRRFQKEFPAVRVRLIRQKLSRPEAVIGNIRKLATDTVLNDLNQRGVDLNKLVLISNDADSNWINPEYIKTILDRAENNPKTDAFLGFIDWSYDAYKAHPEILISTRFMQMLEVYIRRSQGNLGSSGANFAFRPSIYMATGGYRTNINIGEDVMLGRMIKSVRSGSNSRQPIAYLGRRSEINTNARRAISKLLKDGGAAASMWNEGFTATDSLRTQTFNLAPMNLNDKGVVEELINTIEKQLNTTFEMYGPSFQRSGTYKAGSALAYFDNETLRQINRMLWAIGINVKWSADGKFKITNSDRMIKNIRLWQGTH